MNKKTYFRYMAPLYVESECLQCHAKQGYNLGDVRGGISVAIDIGDLQNMLEVKTRSIIIFGITTAALLLGLIFYFLAQLIKKLAEAREMIEEIAITDELTGLFNRRHIMSRFEEEFEKVKRLNRNVGCLMADIDHFKAINDTFGHLTGDQVLKVVSHRILNSVRAYDVLGRYGGEEFLIILPDTGLEDARSLAERIRTQVKENLISGTQVTISLGVTCFREGDRSVDDIIKRADENLYSAKNAGRDGVA
jgi:diguanylate cyclase (GGDEF)-like protein